MDETLHEGLFFPCPALVLRHPHQEQTNFSVFLPPPDHYASEYEHGASEINRK